MIEEAVPVVPSNVNNLRTKVVSQIEFKKKLIGGLDEEDVIKYFKSIGEQLDKMEDTFKLRIDEIESSKRKLQKELDDYKNKFSKAVATAEELNGVIRGLKEEKAVLQEELKNAAKNVSDPQFVKERDDLANRVSELEQELAKSQNQLELSSWMAGIKNEMEILYKQLADLEEMSKANEQLKQQLMQETSRAEKAEKDLAGLGQLVSQAQNIISTKV